MPFHIWTVFCRQSIEDKDDKTVSLIGVLEGITFEPPIPEDLYAERPVHIGLGGFSAASLVTLWQRSDRSTPETFVSRMTISDPKGKVLQRVEIAINLLEAPRHRQTYKFHSIAYSGPGIYFYTIQRQVESKGKKRWVTETKLPFEMGLPEAPKASS